MAKRGQKNQKLHGEYGTPRFRGRRLSEAVQGAPTLDEARAKRAHLGADGKTALYHHEVMIGVRRGSGANNLTKLKPLHYKIVALHLQGWANVDIALHLDMHAAGVGVILNDPLVRGIVDDFNNGVERELEGMYGLAISAIRKGLQSEDPSTALKAVDRFAVFAPRMAEKRSNPGTTAEDVIKEALALAGKALSAVNPAGVNRSRIIDGTYSEDLSSGRQRIEPYDPQGSEPASPVSLDVRGQRALGFRGGELGSDSDERVDRVHQHEHSDVREPEERGGGDTGG